MEDKPGEGAHFVMQSVVKNGERDRQLFYLSAGREGCHYYSFQSERLGDEHPETPPT